MQVHSQLPLGAQPWRSNAARAGGFKRRWASAALASERPFPLTRGQWYCGSFFQPPCFGEHHQSGTGFTLAGDVRCQLR